jgi:hypothetical protein
MFKPLRQGPIIAIRTHLARPRTTLLSASGPRWHNHSAVWAGGIAVLLAVLFTSVSICRAADETGDVDAAQFQKDLQAITASPSRVIGTPGYVQAGKYLEDQLKALGSAVQYRRHEFFVMVPTTTSATLTLGSDARHPEQIYPFWPAEVRLNSTPAEGISGKLVYVGNADYASIHPPSGTWIAVVEATAGQRWTQAAYFGAKAILVLGAPNTNFLDLRFHELPVPVNIPRFYVKPSALADSLRKGAIAGDATVHASVNWKRQTAVNYYVLVSAPKLIPDGWSGSTPPGALQITVPYDSSSLVPDLAPGASQAVQTASGLALLRDAAKHPLKRPVLFSFTGADSIQFLGSRNMMMALAQSPVGWQQELDASQKTLSDNQAMLARLKAIYSDPANSNVDNAEDHDGLDRVAKIIQTDYALEQDDLFRIRRDVPNPDDATQKHIQSVLDHLTILNELRFELQTTPTNERTGALHGKELFSEAQRYIQIAIDRLGGATENGTHVAGLVEQVQDRQHELQTRIDLYHWLANALHLNPDPPTTAENMRLIELQVGLDLSDAGARLGPMYQGDFTQASDISMIQDYKDWFMHLEQSARDADNSPEQGATGNVGADWYSRIRPIVDFDAKLAHGIDADSIGNGAGLGAAQLFHDHVRRSPPLSRHAGRYHGQSPRPADSQAARGRARAALARVERSEIPRRAGMAFQ